MEVLRNEVADAGSVVRSVHEVAEDSVVVVIELVGPRRSVCGEEGVDPTSRAEDFALEELDGLGDLDDGR